MYLNEATLLNNVRVRYNKDHIYVCAASFHLASSTSGCKFAFESTWCFFVTMVTGCCTFSGASSLKMYRKQLG